MASVTTLNEPDKTTLASIKIPVVTKVDIEHVTVQDDPRKWSRARKTIILVIISLAALFGTLASNIYSPALNQVKADLHASDTEIATSLSVFIIVQGVTPLFWSALSEVKGRKIVYITSECIFITGCIVVGSAKTIAVVIAMRCVQALGSAAVFSVGAGSLADIYEPHERGTMMGIYYAAPLLGPSLGPIIGGALTDAWNWRATFYFLAAFCSLSLASFILFKDTFRRERSLAYQAALLRAKAHNERKQRHGSSTPVSQRTSIDGDDKTINGETPEKIIEVRDIEKATPAAHSVQDVRLSLRDINPLAPLPQVLRVRSNLLILVASGILFAFSYSILYTCSRTFSDKYGYDALGVGLVLLSYGVGSVCGSILGGRWSDYALRRLKAKNNGVGHPEMRLESTKWAMAVLPLSSVAYAWLCQEKIHVAAVCAALFCAGFLSIWVYSSTLAYIVDANTGRSTTAVACNSCFRGTLGFAAAEIAVPVQNAIGDGGLYSIWAGLLGIVGLLIMLLIWKGKEWRERDTAKYTQK
ncbi:MFS general substrate transporter [Fomitiporia mediterranea MF3/22]|uniref:MFS general substrate transporter n=1 Tax=Fomitiporia mediterranea (strain MF3/22) TaxID=694068 RepID=UPI0004408BB8|nr:MFS general substrate transporter [Fomitiporia mediterranea MF3/22]EJC98039.1 MFS general substrate transporter [Fomitiporia mediterranea MF3/22]